MNFKMGDLVYGEEVDFGAFFGILDEKEPETEVWMVRVFSKHNDESAIICLPESHLNKVVPTGDWDGNICSLSFQDGNVEILEGYEEEDDLTVESYVVTMSMGRFIYRMRFGTFEEMDNTFDLLESSGFVPDHLTVSIVMDRKNGNENQSKGSVSRQCYSGNGNPSDLDWRSVLQQLGLC